MTSQTGWQTVKIQMLPNIWRSKGNETMNICSVNKIQHEEHFSKKVLQKCGEETISGTLF